MNEAEVGRKFKFNTYSMDIHSVLKLLLVERKSDGQFSGENEYSSRIKMTIHLDHCN